MNTTLTSVYNPTGVLNAPPPGATSSLGTINPLGQTWQMQAFTLGFLGAGALGIYFVFTGKTGLGLALIGADALVGYTVIGGILS